MMMMMMIIIIIIVVVVVVIIIIKDEVDTLFCFLVTLILQSLTLAWISLILIVQHLIFPFVLVFAIFWKIHYNKY